MGTFNSIAISHSCLSEDSPSIVFVCHSRTRKTVKKSSDVFAVLSSPPEPSPSDSRVVCMMADGSFFLMRRDKSEALLLSERAASYPPREEMPSAPQKPSSSTSSRKRKPDDGKKTRPGRAHHLSAEDSGSPCSCDGCSDAVAKFGKSMAERGPQALYTHTVTLFDLLDAVGLLDEATADAINKCCQFSL